MVLKNRIIVNYNNTCHPNGVFTNKKKKKKKNP